MHVPENTGERYGADAEDPVMGCEHWHRYLLAGEFVEKRAVLDIACGEGYGSRWLARRASRVVGVDVNPGVVKRAREKYAAPGLSFRCGSVAAIPVRGQAIFDMVVSWETIEHVGAAAQKAFLGEVRRLLKPGGLFLVSTPDKSAYSDGPHFTNPFHVKEFTETEFVRFLKTHFKHVRCLNQRFFPASFVWASGVSSTGRAHGLRRVGAGYEPTAAPKTAMYRIALCSDQVLPVVSSSLLLDLSETWLERHKKMAETLEVQAEHLRVVGKALQEKEILQAQMAKVLEEQARVLKTAGEVLLAKDRQIAALTRQRSAALFSRNQRQPKPGRK